jgi:hypothetical protein
LGFCASCSWEHSSQHITTSQTSGTEYRFIDLFHFILEWPTPTDFPI